MKRESSPPEAILTSGAKGAPGLVEISNSTRSMPWAPHCPSSCGATTVRKRAASSFSGASSAATAASSFQIGRAHVCTPVTNAHLVCRLLLEKKHKTHPRAHETSQDLV